MPKIWQVKYEEMRKALLYLGWEFNRQNGSHCIYKKPGCNLITIPNHKGKTLSKLVVKNTLKTLDMTQDEFTDLLKNL